MACLVCETGTPCGFAGTSTATGAAVSATGRTRANDFCTTAGLACDGSTCRPCGDPGSVCCEGNLCNGGGCCDGNTNRCVASGASCSSGQGTCSAGGCQAGACGKLGQACCGGGVECTAPYSRCGGNNVCLPCGGQGQRCCPSNAANGDYCGAPYVCDRNNTCSTCGAQGQPCCPGNTCSAGRTCNNGVCA